MKITWLIHFADDELDEDWIFFYSHQKHLGGPFYWMSNFADSPFRIPALHASHLFVSVEQAYQYAKAKWIAMGEERLVDPDIIATTGPPLSSKDLLAAILRETDPHTIAALGRCFCGLAKTDPAWWDA